MRREKFRGSTDEIPVSMKDTGVWLPLVLAFLINLGVNAMATDEQSQLTVTVDPGQIACEAFLGFGVEWDSRGYSQAGVTDEDFALIAERVRWMRLPVARIMMQTKWCYRGEDRFDWDNPEMEALYRHLDLCETIGTTVLLTDWGCEPEWLRAPDIQDVADPRYADAIGTYMDYLVNERGYTCIKYFILVNEPNYEVRDWERWKQGVQNVHAEFLRRGLDSIVNIAGSDHSNDDRWHEMAVDQLQHVLGAYDVHHYANDAQVRPGRLYDYFQRAWSYALEKDPQAARKPFIVGEAGMNDNAQHPRGNSDIGTFAYGVFMVDYAVQAANAGSSAALAWMLCDNSHPGFFWGLWSNKADGHQPRPWFYPWSLLCRLIRPGSVVYLVPQPSENVRVLVAQTSREGWVLCVVNRGMESVSLSLRVPMAGKVAMAQYVYSEGQMETDPQGFPLPNSVQIFALGDGTGIECPGNAVVIMSQLPGI